jgi:hypothetical protein
MEFYNSPYCFGNKKLACCCITKWIKPKTNAHILTLLPLVCVGLFLKVCTHSKMNKNKIGINRSLINMKHGYEIMCVFSQLEHKFK